jgi:hypothetical protein
MLEYSGIEKKVGDERRFSRKRRRRRTQTETHPAGKDALPAGCVSCPGTSEIIGLGEIQSYQGFIGNRQAVFR